MRSHYDYLLVGAGLFSSVFAYEAIRDGKTVLIIEKREHTGGNVYQERRDGISIHKYGAHIFHTSNKEVWDYVNQFTSFNNYINSPVAYYHGEVYNLPFNMNTFSKMFSIFTPEEAKRRIDEERKEIKGEPRNLEEQAISLVGRTIYEKLVKEYTEKQWGRDCKELPPEIIRRLPVRFTYDNNYFNDRYQGIPEQGYNAIIDRMLDGADIILGTDYLVERERWNALADRILYTGCLDEFYGYKFGKLEYRSEIFDHERIECENYQGNAVVNYTSHEKSYTRIIEHKHFLREESPVTWISKEYPVSYEETGEPYYPVSDARNTELYGRYRALADEDKRLITGGRLAEYKYYDMDKSIEAALRCYQRCR